MLQIIVYHFYFSVFCLHHIHQILHRVVNSRNQPQLKQFHMSPKMKMNKCFRSDVHQLQNAPLTMSELFDMRVQSLMDDVYNFDNDF